MHTASIDFETFYQKNIFDVSLLGGHHYTRDSRFSAYLVAIETSTGCSFVGKPEDFDFSCISGQDWEWVSHNARFDLDVYTALREKDDTMPMPPEWHCTADMVSFLNVPRSLDKAVNYFYKVTLKKSVRDNMSGRMFEEMSEFDKSEVLKYAADDAKWCLKLWLDYSKFYPSFERSVSIINRSIGIKGLYIDLQFLEKAALQLQSVIDQSLNDIPWAASGGKPTSRIEIQKACLELQIPPPASTAKTSDEFSEWLDEYSDKAPFARAITAYRSANALLKKIETLKSRIREDGSAEMQWIYFGAHTGRFSGGGGFNAQNLPREPIYGVDLRKSIISPAGKTMVISDLSNIEFRTLMYFANDTEMLKLLADGFNPYEAIAFKMGWEGEKGTLKKQSPTTYSMYKAIALGCGFGMGAERFMHTAKSLTGGVYAPSLEQARENVLTFRSLFPSVVKLWADLDSAISSSANTSKRLLQIKLPSGRSLSYRDVTSDGKFEKYCYTIRKGGLARTKIYGGLLAENLSQALARDIFCYHLVTLYQRGFDVCLHTHDEIACYVPAGSAEGYQYEIEQVMQTSPPWLKNVPISCESCISSYYKK
jgi:hypothetical protein